MVYALRGFLLLKKGNLVHFKVYFSSYQQLRKYVTVTWCIINTMVLVFYFEEENNPIKKKNMYKNIFLFVIIINSFHLKINTCAN